MPFTLRPCPRFPMQWAVTLQRGAIPQVADLLLGFRHAVNTPVSSGPAYADWMSLGASDSGTTVYADLATLHREGDLVKMWYSSTSRRNKPRRMSHICRQRRKWNMTVTNSASRGIRSCIFLAIWGMVNCLIAVQAKASGYEFRQVVLTTICGNLRRQEVIVQSTLRVKVRHPTSHQSQNPLERL